MAILGVPVSRVVIGAALTVHRKLGPGLFESVYERCLAYELDKASVPFERQVTLPLLYETLAIECAYRADLIVNRQLVVELKAVERLTPLHRAQALTYLRLSGLTHALVLNFNTPRLKDGICSVLCTPSGVREERIQDGDFPE